MNGGISNKNDRQTSFAMVSIQTVHGRAPVSQERSHPLHRLVSFLCVLTQERRAPEGTKCRLRRVKRPRLHLMNGGVASRTKTIGKPAQIQTVHECEVHRQVSCLEKFTKMIHTPANVSQCDSYHDSREMVVV